MFLFKRRREPRTAMLTFPRISSGILPASFRTWSKDPPSCRDTSHLLKSNIPLYTARQSPAIQPHQPPSPSCSRSRRPCCVSYHVLHTNADLAVAVEGPIETHNVGGVAFVQHLQLSDDLVPDGGLDFKVDQLGWGQSNKHM